MNFRGRSASGDLSGFLDIGSHFAGELRFDQSFRVDGKVVGTVISEGDLVVGEKGEIEGEIRVGRLFVSGRVQGKVRVAKRLSIHSPGRVQGEIHAPTLVIEEGGVLEGSCAMAAVEHRPVETERAEATPEDAPPAVGAKVVGRIAALPERKEVG